MNRSQNESAYTLIEVLIGMIISLIITAGVARFFNFQYDLFTIQTRNVETSQTLRSVINMLAREIILTGYGIPEGMPRITRAFKNEIEFKTNLRDVRGKLIMTAYNGEKTLYIDRPAKGVFKKGDMIIICKDINKCEAHILANKGSSRILTLLSPLSDTYPEGSTVNLINTISYRYNKARRRIERKIDKGYWQPLGEEITDAVFTYRGRNNRKTGNVAEIKRIDLSLTMLSKHGKEIKITRTVMLRN